jgi:hypothetical protein
VNADSNLARARLRVRHGLVFEHARRAIAVHHDCFQAEPLSSRIEFEPYVSTSSCSAEQDPDGRDEPELQQTQLASVAAKDQLQRLLAPS